MSASRTIEERLSDVEKDVAALKSQVEHSRSRKDWIDQIAGSFRDDPEFDDVLRIGRQIRQADRPKVG